MDTLTNIIDIFNKEKINQNTRLKNDIHQGSKYLKKKQNIKSHLEKKYNLDKNVNNYSSIEGFENKNKNKNKNSAIEEVIQKELAEMKTLENKFQDTLSKYGSTYKQYMEDIMKFVNDENTRFSGKNIKTPDGKHYYVTNAGIARWYSDDAWKNKHSSCINKQTLDVQSIENTGLKVGKSMTTGQPCGYEMQNVKITMGQGNIKDLTKLNGVVASQSTTYNPKYPAQNAIDGNSNTFNHTKNVRGTWWQAHLHENAYIQKIVIHNREDCCWDRFNIVRLDILDDNGSSIYNTIIRRSSEKQMTFIVDNIHKHGRYVRLTQQEDQFLHMSDVQVFGTELEQVKDGNIGYVDDNGLLRVYPKNNMTNTSGTCPSHITNIDNDTWRAFERGSEMTSNTLCGIGNVDPNLKQSVIVLNNQLIQIGQEIYEKINVAQKKISDIGVKNSMEEQNLKEQLDRFKQLFGEMENIQNKAITLDAMVEDAKLKHNMYNYKYITWSLGTILLFMMTYRHFRN
jgi:hypothetical protein